MKRSNVSEAKPRYRRPRWRMPKGSPLLPGRRPRRYSSRLTTWATAARKCASILTLAFLTICCASCARTPAPVQTRTQVQAVLPDPNLLQPFDEPALVGNTNGSLIATLITTRATLQACNGRLAALAEWREKHQNQYPSEAAPNNGGAGGTNIHP